MVDRGVRAAFIFVAVALVIAVAVGVYTELTRQENFQSYPTILNTD